ncbi:Probable histone-lysine N-methyltransferase CG1716 [Gryllus bimaculatus]|nr:Probable histone-lysine N-methyltransferase CG1716 [Gryllus bimaculatus]
MVILGVYVMARRRKGAGGNKAATKATGRTAKKVNGVPEERPNGSLITPMVVESEESCVSQEENHLPLSCKTPVEMCPGDPNLGEPPPMAPFSVHSVPHKKFGKFRCLLENAGTLQSQNCVNLEKEDLSVPETQMEEVVIEHMDGDVGEVIIEHEPVEIGEAQEVVWEEEVVEETVVCEGMEIELEESRSQDGAQLLEEADSQESDYDQMIEVKENDYSNQDDQVMVVRDGEFDGQEMVEVSSIPNMPDGHSVLVVKDARYENNSRHNTIIGIHNEVVTSKEDLDSEDSLGTVRGMEESSQESHMSVQAVKVEISDIPRIIQGKGSAYNTEHFSVNNEILTHPSVIMQAAGKDVSRVLCSQENINSLRECDENRRESDSRGKNLSPKHKKNSRVKNLEYYVDNFNSVRNIELKPSNCSFRVNNENMNKVKLMFSAECGQFPSQEINKKEDPFSSGDREDQEAEVKGDCGEGQDSNSPHPQCSHDFDEVVKNSHDDLDRKHTSSFRNRSGSTDTTGSESGSSCSTGVRRSSRIRSIGLLKQRNRKRNEVEPSAVHESESTEGKVGDSRDVVDSTQEETVKDGSNTVKMPVPVSCPATVSAPPVVPYEVDSSKPVKVKSRWRRSSELEMGGNRSSDSDMTTPPTPSISPRPVAPLVPNLSPRPVVSSMLPPARVSLLPVPIMPLTEILDPNSFTDISKEEQEKKDDDEKEKQERLNSFIPLMENEYLTDRSTSKEAKRMVCDCFLSKEEIMRGDSGCGEDCLNRLLMIECGSRCTVGEQCTNKRFQRQDYAKCEIFKTNKKGFGLRTLSDLPTGTFVMEYVGEVVDQKEFRRRAKDYAKDKNRHYYFMALKSDAIIDATMKGNISRFINHSCDPNAETQKWTVNGELRIGFFSKRLIQAGEEVTFDYQFQRYGKEAQRCFCETTNCRGWIGEDPEKEKRDRKERKEQEIEKLCASGLKNRTHTLTLCRLMVRAEERDSRIQLLKLIQEGEPACRRLFLDYHGLRLIWSWMMDVGIGKSDDEQELRIEVPPGLNLGILGANSMMMDNSARKCNIKPMSVISA